MKARASRTPALQALALYMIPRKHKKEGKEVYESVSCGLSIILREATVQTEGVNFNTPIISIIFATLRPTAVIPLQPGDNSSSQFVLQMNGKIWERALPQHNENE